MSVEQHKARFELSTQESFEKHKQCRCCEAHQLRRPMHITDYKEYEPLNNPVKECTCYCRHHMRIIAYLATHSNSQPYGL